MAETPSPPAVGPQRGMTCPDGAVSIPPATSVQRLVDAQPAGTTFCLRTGVHDVTSPITPKSGNTFVGEYGAILDGSGWKTSVDHEAAIMAHNQDIDDVTIRNLVIRNMPQRGIHAFYLHSDRWTIEYNEITGGRSGVSMPNDSVLRHNYIHHNGGDDKEGRIPTGAYIGTMVRNVLFEENEIAYNGAVQKFTLTTNVTFRNNYVHDNKGPGIWYDGDNVGAMIEGNRVEDNGGSGIFYEISGRGVIRNNAVRRSGDHGVFISTSKDVEIYNNTLEDNFRGIQYFLNCGSVGGGEIGWDLANNVAHHNIVKVGARSGAYANALSHTGDCAPAQVAPYVNGSKRLEFSENRYVVPSTTGQYWLWGTGGLKSFQEWQVLGRDQQGSVAR